MPLRKDTGRGAVWRRVWSWPLHSQRRLIGTGIAVAVLAFAVGQLTGIVEGHRAGPPAHPPSATMAAPPSPSPETLATPASQPNEFNSIPAAEADPAAIRTATEFMQHWVAHQGVSTQQWLAALKPYTTPETYATQLVTVDPSAITATRVTGVPVVTSATTSVVEMDVPTDTTRVHVVVLLVDQRSQRWQVRSYDEAGG